VFTAVRSHEYTNEYTKDFTANNFQDAATEGLAKWFDSYQ